MSLHICIDARMPDGAAGGIQQVVLGLTAGLAELGGPERYSYLVQPGGGEWLRPHLPANAALVEVTTQVARGRSSLARFVRRPFVDRIWQKIGMRAGPLALKVPHSDGTVEAIGADIVHFTWQRGFITSVPSVYHPHDLQHLHLPAMFSPRERAGRDVLYRTLAQQADIVAVSSEWTRQDMIRHLRLPPERVRVVPLAPATAAYDEPTQVEIAAARRKWALPDAFIFYPAQTWRHKNHIGLLEALAELRDRRGLYVPLVCSGAFNDHYPLILRRCEELGLTAQVQFLGFVSPSELQALYGLARAVVIPTRFEAASFPLWEAFLAGTPAACSTVTSLPEQAGQAALLFDPDDVTAMADAIERLWKDSALRRTLAERGQARVKALTWQSTARQFTAIYHEIVARRTTAGGDIAA